MGDISDWLIDSAMDAEADPFAHQDLDDDWQPRPKTRPTCQRCGKANLTWGWAPQGWRLYEGFERPHNCGPEPATPTDFEEVSG